MTFDSREDRADALRPKIRDASVNRSLRQIADEAGLTHGTLSKFLQGRTPSERTLDKLERWNRSNAPGGYIGSERGALASNSGDPDGSPAERLIYYFSHPETRRRFSDHPPMDFVKAAFAIALDEDFPPEELDKLGQWRQQVRGTEDGQD